MAYAGGAAGSAAAAAAAAIARAVKASGAIVSVGADDFLSILRRAEKPLVVMAVGGVFKKNYQYLTSYKGLIFYTQAQTPLILPSVELVAAKQIWIPR